MKRAVVGSIIGFISVWTTVCIAYEPGTHRNMSDIAAKHSVLVNNLSATKTTVLQDLGLSTYEDTNQLFPDIQSGEKIDLGPDGADPFQATTPLSVQQLMQTGAELEDESGVTTGRSLNHFFDPISGLPLNYTFLGSQHQASHTAPDWAANSHCAGSGQTGSYNPSGDDASDSNQCFSLQDAMSYFYNALTALKTDDRKQQFGNLFLTLGHLMHLVQDMAQPQHVRNDPHCDVWECHFVGKYNPSRYEALTYGPTGANISGFAGQYGPVNFPTAGDFWASGSNSGLAQYTNSNFFSAGSLGFYGGTGSTYAAPVVNGQVTTETIQQVLSDLGRQSNSQIDAACPDAAPCHVTFAATTVHDNYKNQDTVNSKAAAVSLFSGDLTDKGDTERFSLNDATYKAAWKFLIPAAIDYSTGLVNYFFRGRLDVQPDPNVPGGYLVINKSSDPMSNGTLALYYDDVSGDRHLVQSWPSVSMAAAGDDPADQYPITFAAPTDPAPAKPGEYMLVFEGKIGAEAGIAGKFIKPSEKFGIFWREASYVAGDYGWNAIQEYNDKGDNFGQVFLSYNDICQSRYLLQCHHPWSVAQYAGATYAFFSHYGVVVYDERNSEYGNKIIDFDNLYPHPPYPISGDDQEVGLAVNSHNLFLLTSDCDISDDACLYEYDHTGKYISYITIGKFFSYVGSEDVSANDVSVCVSGNNTELINLETFSITKISNDESAACASTKNRQFVIVLLSEYPSVWQLNEYDNDGNLVTSIPVESANGIAATPTKVFVGGPAIGGGNEVIHVFDRVIVHNPDGSIKSEQLVKAPDLMISYTTNGWAPSLVEDMYDILNSPE